MREILFRGKSVDTGTWVYGFLSKSRNIEEKPALLKFCIDCEEKGVMMSCIVNPETVGQCTGLTDKNGTKIFEGDIVEVAGIDEKQIAPVAFRKGFFIVDEKYSKIRLGVGAYKRQQLKVIGNIHDNPELLEGNKEDKYDKR